MLVVGPVDDVVAAVGPIVRLFNFSSAVINMLTNAYSIREANTNIVQ